MDNNEKRVILGVEMRKYTFEINDSSYIKIFGENYKVIGYVSSLKDSSFDYQVNILYDGIGENFINKIKEYSPERIEFLLESNLYDTMKFFHDISSKFRISQINSDVFFASSVPVMKEETYLVIIYLFCFSCIYLIIQHEVERRKKEIVIRKIWGYKKIHILAILYKKIVLNYFFSFIISIIITNL